MKHIYLTSIFVFILNVLSAADFEQTYNGTYRYENKVATESKTYTFRVKGVPNGYWHRLFVDGKYIDGDQKETLLKNPTFSVSISKGQVKKIEIQIMDENYSYKVSHEWYFKEPSPKLRIDENSKDFGEVSKGSNPSSRSFTFPIYNDGGGTLTGNISSNANWLSVTPSSFSLTSNQGRQITVTVTTSGLAAGSHSANISVTSNGGNSQWIAAKVKIVKTTGELRIKVEYPENNPKEGARVILYQNVSGSWSEIGDKKETNSSGRTSYWELPAGRYNAEVYFDGGGGSEYWAAAWDENNGAISLNAGETKTYIVQRNEPYAYNYKVFNDDTGEDITGKEVTVGTPVIHRVYVTNKSSVDREVKVKMCLNTDKSNNWNYSSQSVEIAPNSNLSFDFKQTVEETGNYYRKIKVETMVHAYTQTDWWDWDVSVIGKEKVAANISIDPISPVTQGVQFKVTCNITNNGSSARTFNVGAEIKDGETVLKTFAAWKSPTIDAGRTTQVSYYYTVPDDWDIKEYTFHTAVWDGTPGVGEWLAEANETFSVQNPDAAQIIEFIPPKGVLNRGTETACTIKIKNTGTTTRSFWVGLSYANNEATNANWPVLWYDVKPKKTNILDPGDEQIMTFNYIIPINFRLGNYYASAAIWNDFDETQWIMSEPRFDDTRNYEIWKSKETGKLAFTIFGYDSSNQPDIIKQLKYMVKESVYENRSIEEMYYDIENSSKPLLYFGLSTPNVLFGEVASAGGTVLIDLADLFEITPEGKEGFVTVWVDGSVNIGLSMPGTLPVTLGIIKHKYQYSERAIADLRDDNKMSFFSLGFAAFAFTGLEFTEGSDNEKRAQFHSAITIGAKFSLIKATHQGFISKEVKKDDVIKAITDAFSKENSIKTCINLLTNNFYALENFVIPNTRQTTWDDGSLELSDGTWESNLNLSKQYNPTDSKKSYAHQFYINVPENVKKLNILTTGESGNSDLFVKYGGRPDIDGLPYEVSNNTDNKENIIIDNPNQGRYYIMLPSTEPYEGVSLNASLTYNESTKELAISPDNSWNYGDVTVDNSSDKTFFLQNTGSTDLNISDIEISGINSDQFKILSPTSTSFYISAQASIEVKVKFSPTSSGSKSAQLRISNDSDNASPIKSVELYGTGTEVQTFTITINANPFNGGTVIGDGSYEYGETCNLTAAPATRYNFINWTENGTEVSTNPDYSFTVLSDRTLVANFELKTYNISASVNPNNAGTITGDGDYEAGSTTNLIATAASGYNFVNWTEDRIQVSTTPDYNFSVNSDRTLVANFTDLTYIISANASPMEGGTVSGTGGYNNNQTCTLTATAANGYSFVNWTENGTEVSTNPTYSFTVNSNRTLVANFEVPTFTITTSINPENGGTVNGSGNYEYGEICNLTASPETGYQFVNWTENETEVSTDKDYSFQVTANRTLVANFDNTTAIIEVVDNPGVTIYPNPTDNQLFIEFSKAPQEYYIELYNTPGQLIIQKQSASQIEMLDLQAFPGGVYYLKIYNDKFSKTEKIMVK